MKKYERNTYLKSKDLDEAVAILSDSLKAAKKTETVAVTQALGRVSSAPVFAKLSSPYYNASAMDGVCVRYEDTMQADEKTPLRLKKGADYKVVDTGDVIEPPYNAVVMIEDVVEIDENTIQIYAPCSAWQHIRSVGEDIITGELIIPSHHMIRPVDIGALLAGGITHIEVAQKPVVTIIPTGTELIEDPGEMEIGKIIDSNSHMFEAMTREAGGECVRLQPTADNYKLIKETVKNACDTSDIVIIGAGSSAGTEDFTRSIIEEIGELLLHGVAIKPGKPVVLGKAGTACVVGIPGYPVSAYFVFEYFVAAAIRQFLGVSDNEKQTIRAHLTSRVYSSLKHLEFVRVKLGDVGGRRVAAPLSRGAGVTMSLVHADGILKVPKNVEGIEAGEEVEIELMRGGGAKNNLVCIGSHDILLDILCDIMHDISDGVNLTSTHVGSMGGILAMKNGHCHIAPVHLLDEQTGEYNAVHVRKYLAHTDCVLVKGVWRTQGIMVRKNSDIDVKTLEDLTKEGVQFVNRQKGSGTRLLLDYLLRQKSIDFRRIEGYERTMNTHMMVASAVKTGSAHAGVGVLSAANAMDLAFYPIGEEQYDFVVRKDILDTPVFAVFISALKSDALKKRLDVLGGYAFVQTGDVADLTENR